MTVQPRGMSFSLHGWLRSGPSGAGPPGGWSSGGAIRRRFFFAAPGRSHKDAATGSGPRRRGPTLPDESSRQANGATATAAIRLQEGGSGSRVVTNLQRADNFGQPRPAWGGDTNQLCGFGSRSSPLGRTPAHTAFRTGWMPVALSNAAYHIGMGS